MTRALDIFLSLCAFVALLPVFLLTSLILRFTGEGHIFYLQPRVGRNNEIFMLTKFATMLKNSPNMGTGEITVVNDPRVLPVGHFLRKTKINELPQLINIIKGDMSVVGPRPLTERNFAYYSQEARKRLSSVRPGLTGVGSIVFRNEEQYLRAHENPMDFYAKVIKPYKAQLEIWYLDRRTLGLYFTIIFLTAWVVFFARSKLPEKLLADLPEPPIKIVNFQRENNVV